MTQRPVGGDDSVLGAFNRMRDEAKKRGGKLPDLAKPPKPRKAKKTAKQQLGKPTGKDGRAISASEYSLESIGSLVNKEIQQRGWSKDLAGGWVNTHWEVLVGDHIAAHTRVEMLKETTLFISCNSTAWASNLRTMQRDILQKIAKQVGPNVVTELNIYGPKAPSWRFGPLHVKGRGPRDTYG